jgi:capsular exopolysaccharide synthesis family protein
MGKVYDALRRAEEQRTQRVRETAAAPAAPVVPDIPEPPAAKGGVPDYAPAPAPPARAARRPFWKRWFARSSGAPTETVGGLNKRRITMLQPESYVAEQFRTLRGRIDALASQQPLRTIAVTSAVAGEGKTTAAVNLALVSAMSVGRRVLLVDCDLRKPKVHQSLGLRVDAGLSELLEGQATLEEAITEVQGSALQVLPVRSLPPNPSELLASSRMNELIEQLKERYDRVILDVPAVLGIPDAKIITDLCDGMVFVVRADSTAEEEVTSSLEVVDRSRVLGMVLNGEIRGAERYGYGYVD